MPSGIYQRTPEMYDSRRGKPTWCKGLKLKDKYPQRGFQKGNQAYKNKKEKTGFTKGHMLGFKKGNVPWNKGLKTGVKANEICYKRILEKAEEFKQQGFRVIPIGKVIPDIIAIKDNKIYAIEVEYGTPNYDKYTKIPNIYDDIIWLVAKKRQKKK